MKIKLIIFDFDGTLNKPSKLSNSWARIWNKIGCEEEDEKLYQLYKKKQITYKEWANLVINAFRREGVSKELINTIAKETPLINNLEKLLEELKNRNIKIYIFSGGIKNVIEASLGYLKNFIEHIEADNLIFDKDNIVENIEFTKLTVEDKSVYVNELLKKYNLQPEEALFIGNGANDEDVYKTNVKTICFNPDDAHYENKLLWKEFLISDDGLDLLKFIN